MTRLFGQHGLSTFERCTFPCATISLRGSETVETDVGTTIDKPKASYGKLRQNERV